MANEEQIDCLHDWLIELRFYVPLDTKKGHFRNVPQANLLAWYGKVNLVTKARSHQSKEMYYNTKWTQKLSLKPGLVASYNIRLGNGEGLFLFQRFINLSLIYLLRHLPLTYSPGTNTGHIVSKMQQNAPSRCIWLQSFHSTVISLKTLNMGSAPDFPKRDKERE